MAHLDRGFQIEERFERDGMLRLLLIGELDVAVTALVSSRLDELRKGGYAVRLDLSRLTFIDSSGVQQILRALTDARREGWELEVDGPLAEAVARAVDLLGVRTFFWPEEG